MTYEYNPFWQQRIRETVLRALDVHPRLSTLSVPILCSAEISGIVFVFPVVAG